uniref:Photosystem I assembly protein Ycf4 n=1 Tax=Lathyrus sativus TaxID=3860 RepID=D5MAT5_LATSA|nr:photosystem I assembly protein Ycf4 [Lathyrus sativus]ADE43644.1 photosystem I assembly protein Ycf4 [Lathyrus sativus]
MDLKDLKRFLKNLWIWKKRHCKRFLKNLWIWKKRHCIIITVTHIFLHGTYLLSILKVIVLLLERSRPYPPHILVDLFILCFAAFLFRNIFFVLFFYFLRTILDYLLQMIREFIKDETNKKVLCSYVSETTWMDTIPGFQHVFFRILSHVSFFVGFFSLYRFYSNLTRMNIFDAPIKWLFVLPNKIVSLLITAIVSILSGIMFQYINYWTVIGGTNFFDKRKGVLYITRYRLPIPGISSSNVRRILIKEISCLILVTNRIWGDVLYIETRKHGTLPMTPTKDGRRYMLAKHALELSRFLNIPLDIIYKEY